MASHFPPEVWHDVLANFLSPINFDVQQYSEDDGRNPMAGAHTLASVCLVSRSMRQVCLPLLYQRFECGATEFSCKNSPALLLRTLAENPSLGLLMRCFGECDVDPDETLRLMEVAKANLDPESTAYKSICVWQDRAAEDQESTDSLDICLFVSLMPNLELLQATIPYCLENIIRLFIQAAVTGRSDTTADQQESPWYSNHAEVPGLLSRLVSLRLSHYDTEGASYMGPLIPALYLPRLEIFSATQFEWYCPAGSSDTDEVEDSWDSRLSDLEIEDAPADLLASWRARSKLRSVHLFRCILTPNGLDTLFTYLPSLESLYVEFADAIVSDTLEPVALSEFGRVIRRCGAGLRKLTFDCRWVDRDWVEDEDVGDLSSLPNLKEFQVFPAL